MSRIPQRKKSISVTLILSYIVVLAFAISIMMGVYAYIYNIVKKQSKELNQVMLDRVTDRLEIVFNDFMSFEAMAMSDNNILTLMQADKNADIEYDINMLRKNLKMQQSVNSNIDGWLIYLKSIDYVITDSAVLDSYSYYKMAVSKEKSYEKWKQELFDGALDKYSRITISDYDNGPRDCLAFARSLPLNVAANKSAVIMVYAYCDQFKISNHVENNFDANHMCFQILNHNNAVLFEDGNTDLAARFNSEDLPEENSSVSDKKVGIVSSVQSKVGKIKYVMYTTMEQYQQRFFIVRLLMLFGIFAIIVGETIIAFIFFKRIYNPIYEIVTYFDRNFIKDTLHRENEYDFIKNNIKSLIDEKNDVKKVLDTQDKVIKENCLVALLNGKRQLDTEVTTIFKTLGICTVTQHFLVAAIKIENVEELFSDVRNIDDIERYKTSLFIIRNVLEELFENEHMCEVIDENHMVICLLNLTEKDDLSNVEKVFLKTKSFIQENFGLLLSVGIGDIHGRKYAIHKSYEEAKAALAFREFFGKGMLAFYSDIARIKNDDCFFNADYKDKFVNFILVADYDSAEHIVSALLAKNETELQQRCALFRLLDESMEQLSCQKNMMSAEFRRLIDDKGNAAQMTRDMIVRLCDLLQDHTNSEKQIIDKIYKYIEDNYRDGNLNIMMMENAFHINGKILSKKFKEATGERLTDYINKYRVDKSKEILRNRDVNIDVAAQEVGFVSIRTFMRVFKQYEGITPGQYRTAYKSDGDKSDDET